MPEREELGNTDESAVGGGRGQAAEGPLGATPALSTWSIRDTAEAFTFSTSSWGGREAVVNLGDAIARMRSAHPDAMPVVALDAAPMQTRFGRKSQTHFQDRRLEGGGRRGAGNPATATADARARDGRRAAVVTIKPARRSAAREARH